MGYPLLWSVGSPSKLTTKKVPTQHDIQIEVTQRGQGQGEPGDQAQSGEAPQSRWTELPVKVGVHQGVPNVQIHFDMGEPPKMVGRLRLVALSKASKMYHMYQTAFWGRGSYLQKVVTNASPVVFNSPYFAKFHFVLTSAQVHSPLKS